MTPDLVHLLTSTDPHALAAVVLVDVAVALAADAALAWGFRRLGGR